MEEEEERERLIERKDERQLEMHGEKRGRGGDGGRITGKLGWQRKGGRVING